MTSAPEIRPFQPEDSPRLLRIWRAASEIAHPFFTSAQLDEQQALVEQVYLPKAETWVAVAAGQPVGFIGLLGHFIGGLFVAPEGQGRGIGRALVGHAAARQGSLELEVYARNEGALRFYQRLGFTEIGRRPRDDNDLPLELIRLRR
jgi:ribosomal protein S18 acetylase RimI-like enzyme